MTRYKVLSGVKSLSIVEGKGLTKKQAQKISKKVGGYYCGGQVKHKVKSPNGKKNCEKVKTKILIDN